MVITHTHTQAEACNYEDAQMLSQANLLYYIPLSCLRLIRVCERMRRNVIFCQETQKVQSATMCRVTRITRRYHGP